MKTIMSMELRVVIAISITTLLFLFCGNAHADGRVSYDYLDLDYVNNDISGGVSAKGSGLRLNGSTHVMRHLNLYGGLMSSKLNASNNVRHYATSIKLGVMGHRIYANGISVNVAADYNLYRVSSRKGVRSRTTTRNGVNLAIGAGYRISNVELTGSIAKQITSRAPNGIVRDVKLTVFILDDVGVSISATDYSNITQLGLGVRYTF